MGRLLIIAGAVLAACSPAGGRVVLDCDDPEAGGWSASMAPDEEQMLEEVNARRAAGETCNEVEVAPAPALTMNEALRCAARSHAVDMSFRQYFDHLTPEGVSPLERAEEAGYAGRVVSENISEGRPTAIETVAGLVASTSGHCESLMDPGSVEAGMGAHDDGETWWWVQVFGTP